MLPYGRQSIGADDIQAVVEVLQSDWLTTGPMVSRFEHDFAEATGAAEAVAVSNGTAALHAAMHAIGLHHGDEVIVPTMTFAATANAVLFENAKPIFADVLSESLLIDPTAVEALITPQSKAIVAVDYAGHPCDYQALRDIADRHGLRLLADACHALGGEYKGKPVGSLAELNTFSLHPVKPMTTGEGGVITTDDKELAQRLRLFRNHGITSDHRQREALGSWFYEMVDLGFNYRLTDFQCALGHSQLAKLAGWVERRQTIAKQYDHAFKDLQGLRPLGASPEVSHAYHLYVVKLELELLTADRATVYSALRAEGIGVNVHYIPVHLHPYYRYRLDTKPGLCPVAEAAYDAILSLPIFPDMAATDVEDVICAVSKVLTAFLK
jgi:perosamine synthetase